MNNKRAYLYLRASTKKTSQERSVPQQRRECTAYAAANNISIEAEFFDDGASAFSGKERKGFNNLLAACKDGDVEYVLLYSIDRFSRQYKEGMIELLTLELSGIKIIDTMEGVYDSEDIGGAIKQLLGMFGASQFSKKQSKGVKRGIKDRMDAGYPHGIQPYGYMVDPDATGKHKGWVPDPDKSQVIKLIFEMYDRGETNHAIARHLTEKGIKPARAKDWSPAAIAIILRNPIYGGLQGTRDRLCRDNLRRIEHIQTFIDRDLWKRVFDRTEPKNRGRYTTMRKNPLTGSVTCSMCGRTAHIISGNLNEPRYRCSAVKLGICSNRGHVSRENLEAAIGGAAKDIILSEGADKLAKKIIDEQSARDRKLLKSIQPLYDELTSLDTAEAGLIALAMEAGGQTKMLARKLSDLQERRQTVEAAIRDHGANVVTISKQEAMLRLVGELRGYRTNLRPVVDRIDSLTITGMNKVHVVMFGKTLDLDLTGWDNIKTVQAFFIPATMVGRKYPVGTNRNPHKKRNNTD